MCLEPIKCRLLQLQNTMNERKRRALCCCQKHMLIRKVSPSGMPWWPQPGRPHKPRGARTATAAAGASNQPLWAQPNKPYVWLVFGAKPGTNRYSSAINRYVATSCTPISLQGHAKDLVGTLYAPMCQSGRYRDRNQQQGLYQEDTYSGIMQDELEHAARTTHQCIMQPSGAACASSVIKYAQARKIATAPHQLLLPSEDTK